MLSISAATRSNQSFIIYSPIGDTDAMDVIDYIPILTSNTSVKPQCKTVGRNDNLPPMYMEIENIHLAIK